MVVYFGIGLKKKVPVPGPSPVHLTLQGGLKAACLQGAFWPFWHEPSLPLFHGWKTDRTIEETTAARIALIDLLDQLGPALLEDRRDRGQSRQPLRAMLVGLDLLPACVSLG